MIRCVCLVEETEDKILLVQVRHREKYYFPGGKIEAHESMLDAIQREVNEELKLDIPQTQFEYIGTVVGQAYPQKKYADGAQWLSCDDRYRLGTNSNR